MAVDGTYKVEIDTPMGKQESTLVLKSDGDKLNGSIDSPIGKTEFTGGKVSGDNISWETDMNSPMGSIKLGYNLNVSGNDISGEVKAGDFGSFPLKGKRA